jgi:uncharacterized protein YbaR (Trm112 family)
MNRELLAILACPKCRGQLSLLRQNNMDKGLECAACTMVYPIRDGIPVLLINEAVPKHLWELNCV